MVNKLGISNLKLNELTTLKEEIEGKLSNSGILLN